VAHSYADVQSLLAAMAQHGAACSDVSVMTGSTVSGSLSTFADCSGVSSGDTAIFMFKNHASAVAYANRILDGGQEFGPRAEVIGPKWTVNTVPAFADKVIKAVGGQLMAEPSTAPADPAPTAPSAAPATTAPAKPAVTETSTDLFVKFTVTGTGQPTIQYGSDSDTRGGGGHLGALGEGNYLPWSATMPEDDNALYYDVTAQLQGYGDITATVSEVTVHHYSNGTTKTETRVLKTAHASGSYNIAMAEAM
jgi:hypothetical protein